MSFSGEPAGRIEMITLGDWSFTSERLALHRPTRTAVVADLHLGYAQARRRRGDAVPLVSLDESLAPLRAGLQRLETASLVVAGDLFEDGYQPELGQDLLRWVKSAGIENFQVIPGNHDRRRKKNSDGFPWVEHEVRLESWQIVHGDTQVAGRVVQGHLHPILRLDGVCAACFLWRPDRLILPAYCPDAAGGNVLRGDFDDYRCLAIAGTEVLDFGLIVELRKKTSGA